MSCSKCGTEVKFPVRSELHIEKTGSFLAFGLSQEKKQGWTSDMGIDGVPPLSKKWLFFTNLGQGLSSKVGFLLIF